ncbi:MAG: hypothetical protein O9264_10170 [Leptospira sp.]|jgi:hypothetical protein|nr:hypothetical protein [Leptospira sp.]
MYLSLIRVYSKSYHKIAIFGFYFLVFFSVFAESNPWNRLPNVRVLSRKDVSHIVLEARPDHFRVTLLVAERHPYNFKSTSFPFFFRFENESQAMDMAKKLDKYLDSGKSMTISLSGSEIEHVLWGEP